MIAEGGSDVFYKGELAQRIDRDMREHGGLITADDLASYQPRWVDPLRGAYRGYEITTNNPPGGCVCRKLDSAILMVKAAKDRS